MRIRVRSLLALLIVVTIWLALYLDRGALIGNVSHTEPASGGPAITYLAIAFTITFIVIAVLIMRDRQKTP